MLVNKSYKEFINNCPKKYPQSPSPPPKLVPKLDLKSHTSHRPKRFHRARTITRLGQLMKSIEI